MASIDTGGGMASPPASRAGEWPGLLSVLAVALLVRLYVWHHTAVINPDGPLYIFQARGLFTLDRATLTDCGLTYLSIYPYLIRVVHLLVGDWELAARLISLFSGTLLMWPAYFILREFFDRRVSLCATLAFGLAPVMVCRSVDVVRDPLAWFFLLGGELLVVLAVRRQRLALLPLAFIAFALAAWTRFESLGLFLATVLFLPFVTGGDRRRSLLWFCGPVLAAGLILLTWSGISGDPFRLREILSRAGSLADSYERVVRGVAALIPPHQTYDPKAWFLLEAKRFAWVVAGAGVANRFFEGFSYGFSLLIILGWRRARKRFPGDDRLRRYFSGLCLVSFLILYLYMLQTWVMEYRWTMTIAIGGLVFFGSGVEWFIVLLARVPPLRVGWRAAGVAALLLFVSVAPKLFQERNGSEAVFAEVGRVAAAAAGERGAVRVLASEEHIRLVGYFANLGRPSLLCPQPVEDTYEAVPGGSGDVLAYLRSRGIGFLLWEENNWLARQVSPPALAAAGELEELGHWRNHQAGRLVLYRLR